MCEAHLEGTSYFEVGETIEEAIGFLVRLHAEQCGLEIEILPCQTTAYDRKLLDLGEPTA